MEGFFGVLMKREATALSDIKYQCKYKQQSSSSLMTGALLYFIVLFALMLTGWGVIFANQTAGKYLCSQVFLQLDDSLVPSLGTMSGLYYVNEDYKFGGRVAYVAHGLIGYCKEDKIWTLTVPAGDPCVDWVASSSESVDFDVTQTTSSHWYARTASGRALPIDHTYIECYDCKYEDNFCGESLSQGTCVENRCSCVESRFGLRCEFDLPCPLLEVDPRSVGFVGNRAFASKYYLSDVTSKQYYRPIYTSDSDSSENIDIIMFTGRRWVVTSADSFQYLADNSGESNVAERVWTYLGYGFHGFSSKYEVSFISEAIDIDGRADLSAHPLGLEWHPALDVNNENDNGNVVQGPDLSRSVDVQLICATCVNQTNPCFFEGTCQAGRCDCAHGASGSLCQIPPVSNGRCDIYFNDPGFEYDGGDCCESECVSQEFTCGKDETGYIDIGYSQCKSTESNQWLPSGTPVYGVNSAALSVFFFG